MASYFRRANGAVITTDGTGVPPYTVPGTTVISDTTYASELAAITAAQTAAANATKATEDASKLAAYNALLAAGFTDAVAHTLSGYQHP